MNKTLISGKGLTKAYGENTVLHGIDVDIYAGDFTVIMGASGSGKSTLLHTVSGMDRLSGGQLFYQGRDITNASEKELTKLRAEKFGFVFQRTHLIGNLTLYENIQMAGLIGPLPEKEVRRRAGELITQMNLDGAKDRLCCKMALGKRL